MIVHKILFVYFRDLRLLFERKKWANSEPMTRLMHFLNVLINSLQTVIKSRNNKTLIDIFKPGVAWIWTAIKDNKIRAACLSEFLQGLDRLNVAPPAIKYRQKIIRYVFRWYWIHRVLFGYKLNGCAVFNLVMNSLNTQCFIW